jgi:hypothetical protein
MKDYHAKILILFLLLLGFVSGVAIIKYLDNQVTIANGKIETLTSENTNLKRNNGILITNTAKFRNELAQANAQLKELNIPTTIQYKKDKYIIVETTSGLNVAIGVYLGQVNEHCSVGDFNFSYETPEPCGHMPDSSTKVYK